MKKFKVVITEEIGGYAFIKANYKEEAETKAYAILEDEGIEGFVNKENRFDTTHREIHILEVEEMGTKA